jgi:heparan-alpha-glucosaminide N-acetyltransferase
MNTSSQLVKSAADAQIKFHFNEHGEYLLIPIGDGPDVQVYTISEGSALKGHLPILVAFLVIIGLAIVANIPWAVFIDDLANLSSPAPNPSDSLMPLLSEGGAEKDGNESDGASNGSFDSNGSSLDASQSRKKKMKRSQRLHSLDTFRGMALTIMMFVNYGGGGYVDYHIVLSYTGTCYTGLTIRIPSLYA